MINDQITDSVTQIIKYKEGHGSGHPSKIVYKIVEDSTYDDALAKYMDPSEPHLPTIEECDTFHNYMGSTFSDKLRLTRELRDDKTVTCVDFRDRIYVEKPRGDKYPVVLIYIEYMP